MHYGQAWAGYVRPITASAIPALAWVALITTAQRAPEPRDLVHLIGPAFVAFCRLTTPAAMDLVIPALFAGYGGAILWALRGGTDGVPRLALGAGDTPGTLWRAIGAALIGSAVSDVAIVAVQAAGQGWLVPWIVSLGSSLTLVLVGVLALAPDLAPDAPMPEVARDIGDVTAEADLMQRLEALMARDALYLDPDLTLNRLARRLHVPAKRLSEAINRQTGGNVARYVNGHRVQAAAKALAAGQPVTETMLASGFSTKSNFNRAFLIHTGRSPTAWRAGTPLQLPGPMTTSSR